MQARLKREPRRFSPLPGIELCDMGDLLLEADEQVTFETDSGKRNDVVRKDWGFFLTNSLNAVLRKQGFKAALLLSRAGPEPKLYLTLVEVERLDRFEAYLARHNVQLACWLDEWLQEAT